MLGPELVPYLVVRYFGGKSLAQHRPRQIGPAPGSVGKVVASCLGEELWESERGRQRVAEREREGERGLKSVKWPLCAGLIRSFHLFCG